MKKGKIIIPLIIIILIPVILIIIYIIPSSSNYYKALKVFKSSESDRHKRALEEIKNINNILRPYYDNPFLKYGENLRIKIIEDYYVYKRNELNQEYYDTFIAYVDPDKLEIYIMSFDGKKIKKITDLHYNITARYPRWSYDGMHIACYGNGNEINIINLKRRTISQITNGGQKKYPDWSPDGKKIVYNYLNDVLYYDFEKDKHFVLYESKSPLTEGDGLFGAFYPIFLKDNKSVLVTIGNNLEIINIEDRSRKIVIENEDTLAMEMLPYENYGWAEKKLSYSGDKVALTRMSAMLDLNTGELHKDSWGGNPTWSPDDKYIMFETSNPYMDYVEDGIYITPLDDEERIDGIGIFMGNGRDPAWSPHIPNYKELWKQMDDNVVEEEE